MTDPGTSGRPPLHAELVHQEAELARVRIALVWAERAGEPRRAAALRREAGRLGRRIARLRGLLGLPPRDEEG